MQLHIAFIRMVTLLLLFFQNTGVSGQAATVYLPFNLYTNSEGLSSSNARMVAEDTYGFVWIATQDGLNRFDGRHFIHFNKSTAEQLSGNDITSIAVDTIENWIWSASALGGLDAIDMRTLRVRKRFSFGSDNSNQVNDWVSGMLIINDEIWLGTNNGLFVYSKKKNKIIATLAVPNHAVSDGAVASFGKLIQIDPATVVTLVNNQTLAAYDIKSKRIIASLTTRNKRPNSTAIGDISNWEKLKVIALCDTGLQTYSMNRTQGIFVREKVFHFSLSAGSPVAIQPGTGDSICWFSTTTGLFKADLQTGLIHRVRSSLLHRPAWEKSLNQLFIDSRGILWLITVHGILLSYASTPLMQAVHTMNNETLSIGRNFNVAYSPEQEYLISTENGLLMCNNKLSKGTRIDSARSYYSVLPLSGGQSLGFTSTGIRLIKNGQSQPPGILFKELAAIEHEKIGSWLQADKETILLASYVNKGVWVWKKDKHSLHYLSLPTGETEKTNQINALYKESEQSVIIVELTSLIRFSLTDHSLKKINFTGRPEGCIFYDITRQGSYFFVATYGDGILVCDQQFSVKKQLGEKEGLINNNVYNLYPVTDSQIIAATNSGAVLLNSNTLKLKTFRTADGLSSNNLEYNFHPFSTTGRLFLTSVDGITMINPAFIAGNKQIPNLYIHTISIKNGNQFSDTTDLALSRMTIPPDALQVSISFAAPSFPAPERFKYRYKIEELGNNWIDLGNRSNLELIGLSPGTYHVTLQSIDTDGATSPVKELLLIFLPKWYQTWWFKTLLLLSAAGIAYGLYRLRINQLKKEEKIRTQLANDLHDDLGSTLNSVKVFANLAMMEPDNKPYLLKIKESTQEAISGVRDLLWVLDDKKDTLDELVLRIQQFAGPLCNATGVTLTIDQPENTSGVKLKKEEKRNLYLITKEAVNNSMKYARCSKIQVSIKMPENKLLLEISDNGKGFDAAGATNGYGLKNMRQRAAAIQYSLDLITSIDEGTKVVVKKL
jgi:ligand-binding sensor domain-containing protein/two-component sensor histidine kinase